MQPERRHELIREVERLGPWFHNLHLPGGIQTAPASPYGDFPANKWQRLEPHLPQDMRGMTALDIGCNAGFYSLALAARGCQVTAIDHDEAYLAQAQFAAGLLDADVQFEARDAYDLATETRMFDIVLFMGVFYHLRHPLLVLDSLARITRQTLVLQTLTTQETGLHLQGGQDFGFPQRQRLREPGWPVMAFIEGQFENDPTNWWAPNRACVLALLRSAGFETIAEPDAEIFVAKPNLANRSVFTDAEWRAAARQRR